MAGAPGRPSMTDGSKTPSPIGRSPPTVLGVSAPDPRGAPVPSGSTADGSPADGGRSGWRALALDLGPLRRHREFRLLTLSRGVSFLGSMITFVAIPYQ